MSQVVDIIEEFINSLDFSQPVLSHSDNGTNTTIEIENLYHVRKGMTVDVDGSDYVVASITLTEIVVVGVIADPLTVTIPPPYYWHGTPYVTNAQLTAINNAKDKMPMIYLLEIIRESFNAPDNAIDRQADLRLFFLDEANFEDWTNDEFYTNRINGLRKLVDYFVEEAYNSEQFGKFESYQIITHSKLFGEASELKGHISSVFDDRITGIELRIDLPFRRENCIC